MDPVSYRPLFDGAGCCVCTVQYKRPGEMCLIDTKILCTVYTVHSVHSTHTQCIICVYYDAGDGVGMQQSGFNFILPSNLTQM